VTVAASLSMVWVWSFMPMLRVGISDLQLQQGGGNSLRSVVAVLLEVLAELNVNQ
jgi:hypothetical protein